MRKQKYNILKNCTFFHYYEKLKVGSKILKFKKVHLTYVYFETGCKRLWLMIQINISFPTPRHTVNEIKALCLCRSTWTWWSIQLRFNIANFSENSHRLQKNAHSPFIRVASAHHFLHRRRKTFPNFRGLFNYGRMAIFQIFPVRTKMAETEGRTCRRAAASGGTTLRCHRRGWASERVAISGDIRQEWLSRCESLLQRQLDISPT